ncbi:MAG: FAD-dependent oxidoreductase [SAR324 cluster bacterium]|nr:FAD-dependent oxidoreductase [SAR324 cluster bacterium]
MEEISGKLVIKPAQGLLSWCSKIKQPTFDAYLKQGGLKGLQRAMAATPADVLPALKASGLCDRNPQGNMVSAGWQRFQPQAKSGMLVVDGTCLDARSEASAYLLEHNPFGLLEGVLIAAHTFKVEICHLVFSADHQKYEPQLQEALSTLQAYKKIKCPFLKLEIVYDTQATDYYPQDSALVQSLEVWYQIVLIMARGAETVKAVAKSKLRGTSLLTIGGPNLRASLVEIPLGQKLSLLLKKMAAGELNGHLKFDNGMSGFLPLSEATLRFSPEELVAANVSSDFQTMWLMDSSECVVDLVRHGLYRYWLTAENRRLDFRKLLARVTRLVTEITMGRGKLSYLPTLEELGQEMAQKQVNGANTLLSSLRYFKEQWDVHIEKQACPSKICFKSQQPPCQAACPAGIDIPGFMAQIGHGKHQAAVEIITRDNPFPYVCGLICPAPCEKACLRCDLDTPVSIRPMKAVAAKNTLSGQGYALPAKSKPSGKRVAVVGSGPAGLTAAFFLAQKGHQVDVMESQKEPGGMLRYGIPEYRLPNRILDQEIDWIQKLGVNIITELEIGHLNQLYDQDYDAIFLSLGTQLTRAIPLEGRDLPFVWAGIEFLKKVSQGENPRIGPRVIVIGGGNVAIDVAMTALRQGGREVSLVCLENREEMPASPHEVEIALDEGIVIHNAWGPLSISEKGAFTCKACVQVFDDQGRFNPEFDESTTITFEADHIILAIGQAADLSCIEDESIIEIQRGLICINKQSSATAKSSVFAGGDVVHGPNTAVEAVKAGKEAAVSIHAYLSGDPVQNSKPVERKVGEVPSLQTEIEDRAFLKRSNMPIREPRERQDNYQQIELGLTDEMALDEAKRCLRCDICIGCGLCELVCSEVGAEALRLKETKAGRLVYHHFQRPNENCIGCGACAEICPTGAIKIVDDKAVRSTVFTGSAVCEQDMTVCSSCGKPYIADRHLEQLKGLLPPSQNLDVPVCPDCTRRQHARKFASTA